MPHIIVEYSDNLSQDVDVQGLVEGLHNTLADAGVDKARIKSRAIKLENYVVGNQGQAGAMVHITLLLLEGRDDETKKSYSHPLHDLAQKTVQEKSPDCAVTLEVRDMTAETYIL